MSDKKIADMTYSEFCDYIDNTLEGDDRMDVVLGYDDFTIYEDLYHGGYYYLEGGENDASDFFEVELVARLTYSAEHDLILPKHKNEEIMHTLFDCDVCGENVLGDRIEYLWFKKKIE